MSSTVLRSWTRDFTRKWLPRGDVVMTPLPAVTWDKEEVWEASLATIRKHVIDHATSEVHWYRKARAWKRRISTSVRLLAIVGISLAALLPLLQQLRPPQWLSWLSGGQNPLWISLLLAVAAALYAFDRFWGASTGWLRCKLTENKLRDAIEGFELEWERQRVAWKGQPSAEQVDAALQKAKEFNDGINAIINEETNIWAEEFRSSFKQLEDAVKARQAQLDQRAEGKAPGAVIVKVTNAGSADPGTVKLKLDGGDERDVTGDTITLEDVTAGRHRLALVGSARQAAVQAGADIDVRSGRVAVVALTLK